MNTERLSAQETWQVFEKEHQLEQRVYDLSIEALRLIKEGLDGQAISAFAFCADSYYGDLDLSYNVYDGETDGDVLKGNYRYPPEWTHEVDDRLEALVEERFRQIVGDKIFQLQEQENSEEFSKAFSEAYLNSFRRVMDRLDRNGAFSKLNTTDNLWLLVTEVDSDSVEEVRKLKEVRTFMVKSI